MITDEDLIVMPEEEYREYEKSQKNRQKELINLKKAKKALSKKLLSDVAKRKSRLEVVKQSLQMQQSRIKYEDAGYFREKPKRKTSYLGFL